MHTRVFVSKTWKINDHNKNIQVKFEDDIIEMIEIEDYVQTMKEEDADPAKQYKDIKLNL